MSRCRSPQDATALPAYVAIASTSSLRPMGCEWGSSGEECGWPSGSASRSWRLRTSILRSSSGCLVEWPMLRACRSAKDAMWFAGLCPRCHVAMQKSAGCNSFACICGFRHGERPSHGPMSSSPRTRSGEGYWQWSSRRWSTRRSCRTSAANTCEVAELKLSLAFLHAAWQKLGDLPREQCNDEVPTMLALVRALRSDVGSKVVMNLIGAALPKSLPRQLLYGSLSDSGYGPDIRRVWCCSEDPEPLKLFFAALAKSVSFVFEEIPLGEAVLGRCDPDLECLRKT